jgi:hypothetical protein
VRQLASTASERILQPYFRAGGERRYVSRRPIIDKRDQVEGTAREICRAVGTGDRDRRAFFMIVLDTSIVKLALARIGTEFNSGLVTLQWLVDGYALVFASLLLGAGALADRFGAKGAFMWGLLVFALASAASANGARHRWIACRQRGSRALGVSRAPCRP